MSKITDIEKQILSAMNSDKEQAISLIYDNYADALYTIIFRVVQSEEEAKDILQEAFVKIWKNLPRYDSKKGRLYTWLLNIARNSAIDYVRSKRSKQNNLTQGVSEPLKNSSHLSISSSVNHIGVDDILHTLDPKYQQIIDLVYFQGYTQREIEKELGIPLGTIKSRLRFALLELRKKTNTTKLF